MRATERNMSVWRMETSDDLLRRRQRGRVVSASDAQSGGPGFESRSGHLLEVVLGHPKFKSSATLVNNQLVASCQLRFLVLLCCICICLREGLKNSRIQL